MSTTAYIWDPRSLLHDTGRHVESIHRARALQPDAIKSLLSPEIDFPPVVPHDAADWILKVHTRRYHDWVRQTCDTGRALLDEGDTIVDGPHSYDAAIAAVDAVLTAADLVMSGRAASAFSAMRPPGHHALPDRAMGFCLFANMAILARYLQLQHKLRRIAIVDFDVHHGNGTQDIFYDDPSVLFISLHQFPLWPGSGMTHERGAGQAEGTTLNIPMTPKTTELEYLEKFDRHVLPALDAFSPEFLLISAGFDAHRDDPLADLLLTENAYAHMTRALRALADRHARGRIVSTLEGGYNLQALQQSVIAHVLALAQPD